MRNIAAQLVTSNALLQNANPTPAFWHRVGAVTLQSPTCKKNTSGKLVLSSASQIPLYDMAGPARTSWYRGVGLVLYSCNMLQ